MHRVSWGHLWCAHAVFTEVSDVKLLLVFSSSVDRGFGGSWKQCQSFNTAYTPGIRYSQSPTLVLEYSQHIFDCLPNQTVNLEPWDTPFQVSPLKPLKLTPKIFQVLCTTNKTTDILLAYLTFLFSHYPPNQVQCWWMSHLKTQDDSSSATWA